MKHFQIKVNCKFQKDFEGNVSIERVKTANDQ